MGARDPPHHTLLLGSIFYYHPQQSWGKVIFSQASVILLTRGVLSQHALQVVSQHALQHLSVGVPGPGGGLLLGEVSAPGGLPGPGGVCSGRVPGPVGSASGVVWPSSLLIEGGLLVWSLGGPEGHNRRPPHQKAITVVWWRGGDPPKWLLLWAVHILLECILVCMCFLAI